jgi:MFS family permease
VKRVADSNGSWFDFYAAGNEILFANNHYSRNLALARLGELPFFLVGVSLIFLWTRSLYGAWAAVAGVFLYTTLPTILAFAGLAYVDFALSVFLPVTLFAFVGWMENPASKSALALGVAAGLMLLSNLSALLFAPICAAAIIIGWIWKGKDSKAQRPFPWRTYVTTALLAGCLAALIIWSGYRFSITPLNQVFAKPTEDLSQLPAPARSIARVIVKLNPPVPAPAFFKGILASWIQNRKAPPSYALGQVRRGGFWYFYWLDVGLKTPLPFLALALCGIFVSLRTEDRWQSCAPTLSALAILLVSMVVKVDFGIRHILFIYPLLAVAAAGGALRLSQIRYRRPLFGPTIVGILLVLQLLSSISAHPDSIAYFNALAGDHPEKRLLFGCDLDCGQDVGKLVASLKARGVSHLALQVWTSADLQRLDLPPYEVLEGYKPTTGWVAVSVLYLRSGHGIFDATGLDSYAWLEAYQPVEHVGKTIRLYYIPDHTH